MPSLLRRSARSFMLSSLPRAGDGPMCETLRPFHHGLGAKLGRMAERKVRHGGQGAPP